jgi:poly-gamma-glutamate synthesis protein (capsule biosynthesis protein)
MSTESINIVCGGEVSFDLEIRQIWYQGAWRLKRTSSPKRKQRSRVSNKILRIWNAIKISRKIQPDFVELLVMDPENMKNMELDSYFYSCIPFKIDFKNTTEKFSYPFRKLSSFLRSKDLVLVNLENPLSSNPRAQGLLIAEPGYAQAMADAGISLVSLANNHIFDAGENGFIETIDHLNRAGILFVGAGENFEKARMGTTIELKGTTVNFLGYTQYCNNRFISIAGSNYAGILPLDRQLMIDDIKRAREKTDFVFPVLHWGIENDWRIHPTATEIAHTLIDNGADGIIGHGSHVPQAIEIYKNKPIIYSTGNFIFGHNSKEWADNFLAEIIIDRRRIREVIIHPISAKGEELFQPELLSGSRADSLLQDLRDKSLFFDTKVTIQNDAGHISIY